MADYAATIDDIREAAKRIAIGANRTPIARNRTLDRFSGRELYFKCEHLQRVGAFKFRGACNAVLRLPREEAHRGVMTHSSGNHAQALALAARMRNIPAFIIMPSNAPVVKERAVRDYGATLFRCEPTLEAREREAAKLNERSGATFIHPYDNGDVIAGQGTATLELLADVADLDAIVAPVGGGGLLSGTCIAARALNPKIRLFAAEPAGADDTARSLAAGKLIPQTGPHTIADGLLTSLGEKTWPIIRDHVDDVVTVAEDEIIEAMRLSWERAKLLIEPSAAVAVAAALTPAFKSRPDINRVGVILSGGNVDLENLPFVANDQSLQTA